MAKYSGSGWHKQSIRHSNARKYGKAGGTYKSWYNIYSPNGKFWRRMKFTKGEVKELSKGTEVKYVEAEKKHYGEPMSFAGKTKKILRVGTIPIHGRRGSLYINLELRPDGELSVTGTEAPLPSGNALGSTGQIDMKYKHANKEEDDTRYKEEELTKPEQISFAKGWNTYKWFKLLSIWKHKHLTKNLTNEELQFLNSLPETDKQPAWV
jgi:hypothetical protein